MPSEAILKLSSTRHTVTDAVSDNPTKEIAKVAHGLFADKSTLTKKDFKRERRNDEYTSEDLDRAEKCGTFPYRPSDLFLKMYSDVLDTLERDPLLNMVSPSLMGSSGVIPLSIVSVIPDIMRHYRNLIANAEIEIMIATNYWERSYSSSLVHDGLIELSRRHEDKPTRPVVKLIYDRGNAKQVIKNHRSVPAEEWEALGLPKKDEIPNIEFEVMNFHRPVMGTFHAKYMIVDRKVACLNSNNIQDRVNVEMMTHIEGPIVDAFYDMSLLSWAEVLQPPLPLLKGGGGAPKVGEEYKFAEENRYLKDISLAEAANTDRASWKPNLKGSSTHNSTDPEVEVRQTKPREAVSEGHRADAAAEEQPDKPDSQHPDPIAKQHVPQNEQAGAEEVRHTDEELAAAESKYGASQAIASHLNAGMQDTKPSAGPELAEGFHPHILHKPHKPFPIAMVNRPPHGTPGHGDVDVPQNAAWLAGFRLAQKNIFIQTPTFNATPVVKEILDACRRGVECTLYLDLGFNDGGEQMPMQGGTNSKVVADMYKTLNGEKKQQFLRIFWYTAKDQERPIDATEKKRNCHVKFCTIDDQVAIQGNGNQDTQSWFHSQEINIMVDSPEMCAEWRAGIENNQNTAKFGALSDVDGLWRDKEGNVVDSSAGKGGPMAIVKGVMGAVARARGKVSARARYGGLWASLGRHFRALKADVGDSRRKRAETYLFTSHEADKQDFYSIHALGITGLSRLKTLEPNFAKYDENLFSDAARGLDRTLQSASENAVLDGILGSFLRDLGPYLLEAPASKALEWLVRRFRVNEFNLDELMALFLPYHDTPHFAKMVSIMHVGESRLWSFLAPVKAGGTPLPRSILVDEMLKSIDLARFVTALLPESLTAGRAYRTLVGFTAGVTVEYLTRMKKIQEDTMAFILPAAMRFFAADSDADCALCGYISLATLSQRCRLSSEALVAVLTEMIKGQHHIKPEQVLPLLIAVLGPQDELNEFSDAFCDSLLRLPAITDIMPDCLQWVGAEKLVLPLLPNLVRRASEKLCSDLLASILHSSTASQAIIERCVLLCVEAAVRLGNKSNAIILQLLSVTYQRHGTVFSDAYAQKLKAEENEKKVRVLEAILHSVVWPSSSTANDIGECILSSHAPDTATRAKSVQGLVNALAAGDTNEDLYEAIRSRVVDTNATIIEALYSHPQAIIPVLSNLSFIESVSKTLAAPEVSRSVMRLHFTFIAGEFCGHNTDLTPAMFARIYFPYILFTKPRQKTAGLVWQSLRHSKLADHELLAGCMDIVFPSEVEEGHRSVEDMATLNLAVAARIAGNIVASNSYHRHLDMLSGLLASSDAHTADAAYLLSRSLLNQLSGEHRIDAAHRVLNAMGLQSLDTLCETNNAMNLQDVISDDSLSKSVVVKPSSGATLHRLQAAILALLPIVQRPVGVKIDWMGDEHLALPDTRGKCFVELARAVYALANSSSAAQGLSTSLLRALFVNLREETLLFLAGIWSTDSHSGVDPENMRLAALFHGAAFLKAQSSDFEHPQDFQVILPSLLIAMRSKQRSVRKAAMDCVDIIAQSSTSTSTTASPTIYALDLVYGTNSDGLQYLEQSDFGRYISSLQSRREHFINDLQYLGIFQQEILCKERSESKKEAGYKHRVLCYMLSHAIVWPSLEARVDLLNTLKNVQNAAKLQMLLPLIQHLMSGDPNPEGKEGRSFTWKNYSQSLLEAFDETTAVDLNEVGSGSWTTFMRLIRSMFSDGAPTSIRDTIVQQLRAGLFNLLTVEHQIEVCVVFIDDASIHTDSQPFIKETLGALLDNAALIISLLTHFQPSGTDSSHRAAKRVKTAADPESGSAEQSLHSVTFLVEILVAQTLPGSVELMTCAVDVLTRVFHAHSSKSDANYLMQLLMSMIESLASSLSGNTTLPPGSIRMEILVELLRVSDNPQTFNQALLLIASLARLSPEFVMQNVMPVFTFMGSNVFHRDDSYSFRVVQKTVESIVPVMINALRTKHIVSLDLQIASREFLRVFTDAATHVPRHRRTQFFNHLVEVLGPEEFTVSVCLLLVDKAANRVVRQKPGDVANALGLPLTILQANFKATPFKIVEQLLRETTRLLCRITEPDVVPPDAFLESHKDGEQTPSTSAKRQIQAILIFVDLVLQQTSRKVATADESAVQESVQILLRLSELDHRSPSSPEFPNISRIALKTLGHLLRVISATEFASSIVTIIASRNPTIESGAMNLLSSRLANVAPKTRQEISPTITRIIEHACESLKTYQDLPTLQADLKALSAIAQTAIGKETLELTKALPIVLQIATQHKSLTADILACILPLSTVIGPRILPFFRGVVELCCDVLAQTGVVVGDQPSRAEQDAQSIIVALLSSLSQFWGSDELVRLTTLSLDAHPASSLLRKTLAKRIPAKQLLSALFRVWSDVAANNTDRSSRQEAFFDLFKRVVRTAPREDVHEHLRQTFKLFLEAFDIIGEQESQDAEPSETASLAAFVEVVTKLNEAVFKPLFRRLFDWAFNETAERTPYRQITFCRVLTALIKMLKGLVTPYMGVMLEPLTEKLNSYRVDSRNQPPRLWLAAIELFQTSLELDEGAFWRTDKLRALMPPLVAQVAVCPVGAARAALQACLGALAGAADDAALLKALHLQLLLQTRADAAPVRLCALECAGHVWRASGDKLTGFVADVVPFIAECADDEHDEVAKEARRLKKTVESRCGSLDVLMQ